MKKKVWFYISKNFKPGTEGVTWTLFLPPIVFLILLLVMLNCSHLNFMKCRHINHKHSFLQKNSENAVRIKQ